MNKRTFLQRLASTVAAIALAPALCRGIGRLETYQEAEPPCTAELIQEMLDRFFFSLVSQAGTSWEDWKIDGRIGFKSHE